MPVKEPGVKRDYGFDYALELGRTPEGEPDTLESSTWEADEGLIVSGENKGDTKTSAWVEGGAEGEVLTVNNYVRSVTGRTYRRVLTLVIRAAVDPEDDYLIIASDVVRDLAPPPETLPDPDTYSPRAARAERLVFNYLDATGGGVLKSKTITGVNAKTFNTDEQIRAIVAGAMGDYYKGPDVGNAGGGGDDGIARVGRASF